MNWAPLLVAVVLGAPAIALHARYKAPRFAAILGGCAVVFIVAGVPPLLAGVGRPLAPGLVLIIAMSTAAIAGVFVWLDIVKKHHTQPLFGRKGQAHHFRPQYATAALALAVLMIAANWPSVTSGVSHGFGQTWSSIVSHRPGS